MGDLATRAAGELFDPQAELLVNDGRVGAVGSGEFVLWDASSGNISARVKAEVGEVAALWAWGGDRLALRRPGATAVAILDEQGAEVETVEFDPQVSALAVSAGGERIIAALPGTARLVELGRDQFVDLPVEGLAPEGRVTVAFLDDGRSVIGSAQDQCPPQLWEGDELDWSADAPADYWHLRPISSGFVTVEAEGDSFAVVVRDPDFIETARHPLGFRPTALRASDTHAVLTIGDGRASDRRSAVVVRLADGATVRTDPGEGRVVSVNLVGSEVLTLTATTGVAAFDADTGEQLRAFALPD